MALFLNGKQIDKENVYADNIPMSASDSETIAEKFDGLNATLLPIESGSATNTKDYIDSGLSGKADTTALKYKVGDTLDLSGLYLIGQVSNGRYRFICNLPLPKSVEDIASASVSSLSYAIIGNGGYYTPPAGMTTTFTSSAKICNGLQMTMYFSADFSSLTLDDIYLARIISGTLTFA